MPQHLIGKHDAQDASDLVLSQIVLIYDPPVFQVLGHCAVAPTDLSVLTEPLAGGQDPSADCGHAQVS